MGQYRSHKGMKNPKVEERSKEEPRTETSMQINFFVELRANSERTQSEARGIAGAL